VPQGMTSTVLPANVVAKAALDAIADLQMHRADLRRKCEDNWIKQWRNCHSVRKWFASDEDMRGLVPPGIHVISEQYRAGDEATLRAIKDLALAAADAHMNLTVQVTADDFRLLSPFYKKKGK
jgi:hypothetical protein